MEAKIVAELVSSYKISSQLLGSVIILIPHDLLIIVGQRNRVKKDKRLVRGKALWREHLINS